MPTTKPLSSNRQTNKNVELVRRALLACSCFAVLCGTHGTPNKNNRHSLFSALIGKLNHILCMLVGGRAVLIGSGCICWCAVCLCDFARTTQCVRLSAFVCWRANERRIIHARLRHARVALSHLYYLHRRSASFVVHIHCCSSSMLPFICRIPFASVAISNDIGGYYDAQDEILSEWERPVAAQPQAVRVRYRPSTLISKNSFAFRPLQMPVPQKHFTQCLTLFMKTRPNNDLFVLSV